MSNGMTRCVVGFDAWTDNFTVSPLAGSWHGDYPLLNLGGMPLYRPAKASASVVQWTHTSAEPFPVQLLAFVRVDTGAVDDTFQIDLYEDTACTSLLTSTGETDFWPVVYDRASLPAEHESFWTGRYTLRELQRKKDKVRPVWLDQPYLAKGIKVTVNGTGFRCSLFEIALGYELGMNPREGADWGFQPRTTSIEADGGHEDFDRRPARRVFRGTVAAMRRDEVMTRVYEMIEDRDLDRPFLWFPHPDESLHWLRTVWFVRNAPDLGLFKYVAGNRTEVPFAFRQVL